MIEKNEVLLKIHRRYNEKESVRYLESVISDLRKEIGILKSEKAELEDNLLTANKKLKENDLPIKKEISRKRLFELVDEENKVIYNEFNEFRKKYELKKKDCDKWMNKYYSLLAVNERQEEFLVKL